MVYFAVDANQFTPPPGIPDIAGSIVIASKRKLEHVGNATFRRHPYRTRFLFDPQLYLSGLDPTRSRSRCINLSTYDWFDTGDLSFKRTDKSFTKKAWNEKLREIIDQYWTGRLFTNQSDIDDAVKCVCNVQRHAGAEAVVLASPLTTNPNSDLQVELEWIDRGIVASKAIAPDAQLLATVALAESALIGIDAFENALIDTIIDQLTSRDIDGVYIVITSNSQMYYLGEGTIVGALLRLTDGFKRGGMKRVVINYATLAGILTLATGADTLCTGWHRSERRLNLQDLVGAESDRLAYPAYYCDQLASEINISDDLPKLAKAKVLDNFMDVTTFSAPLLKGIARGIVPKDGAIPQWDYRGGITGEAAAHFATSVSKHVAYMSGLADDGKRVKSVKKWLTTADGLVGKLMSVIKDLHQRTEVAHQRTWLRVFEDFLKRRDS